LWPWNVVLAQVAIVVLPARGPTGPHLQTAPRSATPGLFPAAAHRAAIVPQTQHHSNDHYYHHYLVASPL